MIHQSACLISGHARSATAARFKARLCRACRGSERGLTPRLLGAPAPGQGANGRGAAWGGHEAHCRASPHPHRAAGTELLPAWGLKGQQHGAAAPSASPQWGAGGQALSVSLRTRPRDGAVGIWPRPCLTRACEDSACCQSLTLPLQVLGLQ